jgi:hypothetical protein
MIRIYYGGAYNIGLSQKAYRYSFPEVGIHPRTQVAWAVDLVNKYLETKREIILETYSDFIVRAINNEIARKTVPLEEFELYDEGHQVEGSSQGFDLPSVAKTVDFVNGVHPNIPPGKEVPLAPDPWEDEDYA